MFSFHRIDRGCDLPLVQFVPFETIFPVKVISSLVRICQQKFHFEWPETDQYEVFPG
jgi:hypothetical protein